MVYDFSEILVYLYEPQAHIRNSIRSALNGYGFNMLVDFHRYEDLVEKMHAQEGPDLIICDVDQEGQDVVDMISKIRRNEFGENPFIATILTTWHPTPEHVRSITNSGVDDLLGKPISPKLLMDRVNALISNRKPFVVTSEYIGPDRRKPSKRPSKAKTFDVPNTLAARAKGEVIPDIDLAIHQSWSNINSERQSRNAFQLAFLVDLILPALKSQKIDKEIEDHITKLVQTCSDAMKRLKGKQNTQAAAMFKQLAGIANAIQDDPYEPEQKHVELLKPLAMAVNKLMNPDKNETALAAEISSALETFASHKSRQT